VILHYIKPTAQQVNSYITEAYRSGVSCLMLR